MENMTYRDMLDILLKATSCELDQNISIYNRSIDEFYPALCVKVSNNEKWCPADGILDNGHLYLEIEW